MKRSTFFIYLSVYAVILAPIAFYGLTRSVHDYQSKSMTWVYIIVVTLSFIMTIYSHNVILLRTKHDKPAATLYMQEQLDDLTRKQRFLINVKVAWHDNKWNFLIPFVVPFACDAFFFSCYRPRIYIHHINIMLLIFVSALLGFVVECFFPRRRTTSQRVNEAIYAQRAANLETKGGLTIPSHTNGELTQVQGTGQLSTTQLKEEVKLFETNILESTPNDE